MFKIGNFVCVFMILCNILYYNIQTIHQRSNDKESQRNLNASNTPSVSHTFSSAELPLHTGENILDTLT